MWESCYRTDDIKDIYKFEEKLGEGSFGIVRKVVQKSTGEEMAVKIIEKDKMGEDDHISLRNEVEHQRQIDHPNVVNIFEVFEAEKHFYIVLELMTGGQLFDRIIEKEHYSEKEAADTIRPIIDAVRYCHLYNIIHRDLKPENLLYEKPEEGSVIKISDFGLSRIVKDELAMTACGTPGYVAPEILSGHGYGKEVDFWSIGVILYIMLCGFPPFYEESTNDLFQLIKKGDYDFPSPYWDDISDMAKELIQKLLRIDPKERLTAEELLKDPWIVGHDTPRKNLPATLDSIKKYKQYKIKKAGIAVFAINTFMKIHKESQSKQLADK